MNTRGKNRNSQFTAEDTVHGVVLSVDSREEVDAINFLCEAHELSAVDDFQYQPPPFELFQSVDYVDVDGKRRCLFRDHVYTADFCVLLDPSRSRALAREFKVRQQDLSAGQISVYVDVKGTFAQHDGGRSFSLNQKWVWQTFGKYVYKLVPKQFFAKFGAPLKSFYSSKTKKARKMFAGMKSVRQVLGGKD